VALVALRRGGERAEIVLPWQRGTLVLDTVDAQVGAFRGDLSSRLVSSIAREAHGLDELPDAASELALRRLVGRHGGAADDTARLVRLRNVCGSTGALVDLLTIARFLAQEGR
jgi:hypothetical protein